MRNAGRTCKPGQDKASLHKRYGMIKLRFRKLMLQSYPSVLSNMNLKNAYRMSKGNEQQQVIDIEG